jgi:ABC-type transport system involved in multi-copper enzyme maturation permease subunit
MAGKVFSRETVKLILAAVMALGLFSALVFGTAAIILYAEPYGGSVMLVADAAAWLFAAAFLMSSGLVISEEIKKGSGARS